MEKNNKKTVEESKVKAWWNDTGKQYAICAAKFLGGAAAVVGAGFALVKWGEHCHEKFVAESIEKLMDATNPDPTAIEGLKGDKLMNKLVEQFNEEKGVEDFIENTKAALEFIDHEAKERGIGVGISYATDMTGSLTQEINVYKDNINLDSSVEWTMKS